MGSMTSRVAILAFGMPSLLLLAAVTFYFARGGDVISEGSASTVGAGIDLNPCADPSDCLEPSSELLAAYPGDACNDGGDNGTRLCMATLGDVDAELVAHLVGYYASEYGLHVRVLRPMAIPDDFAGLPYSQYSANWLMDLVDSAYPAVTRDGRARLVILTPVDVWLESRTGWRWAFGQLTGSRVPGHLGYVHGIVSPYRMDGRTWGWYYEEDVFYSRVQKMTNKYIAVTYFGLPFSPDPTSATYSNILSVHDLDGMAEHIPVP